MSFAVQRTTSVTVDDNVYIVEKMNPNLQRLIEIMDDWRQKEADLDLDLTMVKCAIRDIQNQLLLAIRSEAEKSRGVDLKLDPAANSSTAGE